MRDFKGMKRQRNRGRGGGGGGKPQHNANRAFDSNGPEGVKVRGAAQHIYEKYQQLARDAGSAGDRVLAENYLQHAEHYFRVLRAMQPQRPVGEIIGRDQFASGYDIDFEEEGQVAEEGAEEGVEAVQEGRRDERQWQRDERRDERQREDRQQGEFRARDDRGPRDDYRGQGQGGEFRSRDDRGREERGQGEFRPREDRYRDDRRFQGERQGRFQGERPPRQDREYRAERDPLSVIEPQAGPIGAPTTGEPPPGGVLRSEDGAMSHAPAFLQARSEPRGEAVAADEGGEGRRPRRRRPPRSFEAGEAAPAEVDEG
jgi:hypothetical protein